MQVPVTILSDQAVLLHGAICPAFGSAYDAQVSGFASEVFDHVTLKSILSILYSIMSILYYRVINNLFFRKAI